MAKRDDNPQRLNLIVPLELLEELRKIAKERFKARDNHKTGHPEISQTMLKLIRLGIEAVISEDLYQQDEDARPQTLNDKFDGLTRQFGGLSDELERVKERVKELQESIQIEQSKEPIHTPIHINKGDVDDADDSEEVIQTLPLIPIPRDEDELDNKDEPELIHTPIPTPTQTNEDEELIHTPIPTPTQTNEDEELIHTPIPTSIQIEQSKEPVQRVIQIEEDELNNNSDESEMTQSQMARYLEVKQPTLSSWIKDKKWYKLQSISKYTEEGWVFNSDNGKSGKFERKL